MLDSKIPTLFLRNPNPIRHREMASNDPDRVIIDVSRKSKLFSLP